MNRRSFLKPIMVTAIAPQSLMNLRAKKPFGGPKASFKSCLDTKIRKEAKEDLGEWFAEALENDLVKAFYEYALENLRLANIVKDDDRIIRIN